MPVLMPAAAGTPYIFRSSLALSPFLPHAWLFSSNATTLVELLPFVPERNTVSQLVTTTSGLTNSGSPA